MKDFNEVCRELGHFFDCERDHDRAEDWYNKGVEAGGRQAEASSLSAGLATIADFKPGMTIRGKSTGNVFVVTANYGARVTAVMTQDICNPNEWEAIGS